MQPDDHAVQEFLGRSMIVQVATLSQKGVPFLTPLWFVCDQGRLYMATGQTTPTVRNITANPGVVLLFDAEQRPEDHILRIRGRASWHEGLPSMRPFIRMALKYYLSPGGLRSELLHCRKWLLRQRLYAQGHSAVIAVAPDSAEFVPRPRSAT